MTLYHFNLHGHFRVGERHGVVMSNDADAEARAVNVIRRIKAEDRQRANAWALEITQGGRRVAWIDFTTVE